jgi:nitrogen fixation protein NifQ
MEAGAAYCWLIGDQESFQAHVLASILALAISEAAREHRSIGAAAGYAGSPSLLIEMFPHAAAILTADEALVRSEDEAALHDLLQRGATSGAPLELLLAGLIARRAQHRNHLWQDLGLRYRGELSRLMTTWFAPLARRNTADMKWKKFFSRLICRDASYTLCTAPSCGECSDYDNCFTEETGESLLAHLRRNADSAA